MMIRASPVAICCMPTKSSAGCAWALICAALVWVFIWHTRWGYEIRSVGASQSASAYAGISYPKVVILAMVISGMLSGFFALNVLQGELLVAGKVQRDGDTTTVQLVPAAPAPRRAAHPQGASAARGHCARN